MRRKVGLAVLLIGVTLWFGQLHAFVNVQVTRLPLAEGILTAPAGMALRPDQSQELWIANQGNDSLATIDVSNPEAPVASVRTDAYAEHFAARPTGIAFGVDDTFAIANNSNNELRGMRFVLNPERNEFFVGNNFMGPTLFAAKTYALAGQNKPYLADWPQPGIGHDPPNDMTPTEGCPLEYWSETAQQCHWPREGSHLDMLHGSPLTMGIVHHEANAYFLLDGCGSRTETNQCRGDGHLVRYDFNHDHQEGNGYHGDGLIWRYPEVSYQRVGDIPSGMVIHGDRLYFANTGAGTLESIALEGGRVDVVVAGWSGRTERNRVGPGVIDWQHIPDSPGDGEEPANIDAWIATQGDPEAIAALGEAWIRPMEILSEYAYVYDVGPELFFAADWLSQPSALAADDAALYVADYGSGWLAALDWETGEVLWRQQTDLKAITGLVVAQPQMLYVVDGEENALAQVRWEG